MRRCILLAALLIAANGAHAQDAARRLAQDAVIVDTHVDAPGILMDKWADLGIEARDREFDYPKARAGGLDVAFMSIYTSHGQDTDGSAWQVANRMIDGVHALVQRHPGRFALLTSPADVARLREGGRVLLPLGMENGARWATNSRTCSSSSTAACATSPWPTAATTASPIRPTRATGSGTG